MSSLIIDLHTHSKYAQATSKNLDLAHMEAACRQKGVQLFGTGDFTHPKWQQELKALEDRDGLAWSKSGFPFMYTTEISLIYKDKGRGRRTHNLVLAPDRGTVDQVTEWLLTRGRVDYDGRPTFGIRCPEFVAELRSISKDIEVIPAHIWTPWFSLFGSNSGWDSLNDCFEDQVKHVHAVETGLSSDPAMNWRLSQLDSCNIVSFSDAHSAQPWRVGREATIVDVKSVSYSSILKRLRTLGGVQSTIEVDPSYGKYHVDGHRACGVVLLPAQTRKLSGICPVCGKPLTRGVLGRVEDLADRKEGCRRASGPQFEKLLPLHEVLSFSLGKALATKSVQAAYDKLVHATTEFHVLRSMNRDELLRRSDARIAQAVLAMRAGNVEISPGYDGVYGVLSIPDLPAAERRQKSLGEF